MATNLRSIHARRMLRNLIRVVFTVVVMFSAAVALQSTSVAPAAAAPAGFITPTPTPVPISIPVDVADPAALEEAQAALDAARAEWAAAVAANGESYDIEYRRTCFCIRVPTISASYIDGVGVSFVADDGLPVESWMEYSVPSMFDVIQDAINQGAVSISVTYGTHGVPQNIAIDYSAMIADEELYISVFQFAFTGTGGSSTVLTDGVASAPVSGAAGDEFRFTIDVPSGATELSVVMTGGGDADLYTLFGAPPTEATWDCRPYYDATSNETCTLTVPATGTHHILVRGWGSFTDVTVTATITMQGGTRCILASGVPQTGLQASAGNDILCAITVPDGATQLTVDMFGGGDADLYTRFGAAPTDTDWLCRPYRDFSSNESCTAVNPSAGTWWIRVDAYRDFADVTLVATIATDPIDNEVTDANPIEGISGAQGDIQYFYVDVPSIANVVSIVLSGGTGDADLYTRFGATPTFTEWDCRPYIDQSNNEVCTIFAPEAGVHEIMIHGYGDFAGATLSVTIS